MFIALTATLPGAPDPNWLAHDRERPLPPVVNPGTFSSQEQPGVPPADAVLASYAGDYGRDQKPSMEIRRLPDGLLALTLGGTEVVLQSASLPAMLAS